VKLSFGRITQLPRALSESEIRGLLNQAKQSQAAFQIQRKGAVISKGKSSKGSMPQYRAIRNLALVDLLFATGMRVGEVSSLNLVDFAVVDSCFRVKGKGGRDRLAFVVDEQTLRIQREHVYLRSAIASDSLALFVNGSGKRLSTQGIANIISKFRKDAGIERNITPHMLRHTVATLLLRNGVDIRVVQEFLGHASIATTQRYTHITKDHLIEVLRKRHPSFRLRTAS
jgi:site-specific recombinase XerD